MGKERDEKLQRMASMRTSFAVKLARRIGEMELAIDALSAAQDPEGVSKCLNHLHNLCHKLMGFAGIFGTAEVVNIVTECNNWCEKALNSEEALPTEQIILLNALFHSLKEAVQKSEQSSPIDASP